MNVSSAVEKFRVRDHSSVLKHDDLERILFNRPSLHKKIVELGEQISQDYHGEEITVVCLLEGSLIFAANLLTEITTPLNLFSIKVNSYEGTLSTGTLKYNVDDLWFCKGKHILLIDDILDSGLTLSTVKEDILNHEALSVKTCVLLNKLVDRNYDITPDYKAFDIKNEFVVGFGMDYNGRYRNLPYIGVLKPQG